MCILDIFGIGAPVIAGIVIPITAANLYLVNNAASTALSNIVTIALDEFVSWNIVGLVLLAIGSIIGSIIGCFIFDKNAPYYLLAMLTLGLALTGITICSYLLDSIAQIKNQALVKNMFTEIIQNDPKLLESLLSAEVPAIVVLSVILLIPVLATVIGFGCAKPGTGYTESISSSQPKPKIEKEKPKPGLDLQRKRYVSIENPLRVIKYEYFIEAHEGIKKLKRNYDSIENYKKMYSEDTIYCDIKTRFIFTSSKLEKPLEEFEKLIDGRYRYDMNNDILIDYGENVEPENFTCQELTEDEAKVVMLDICNAQIKRQENIIQAKRVSEAMPPFQ